MNETAASIPVDWDEALDIATDMKLRARDLQKTANELRNSQDYRTAATLDSKSARLDAFADKLLGAFMDAEEVADVTAAIEE